MANTDLMLVKKKYTVEKFLQELKKSISQEIFSSSEEEIKKLIT